MSFFESIGKLFLPKGGNVFAPTRNVAVYQSPFKFPVRDFSSPKEAIIGQSLMHLFGFGNFVAVWHEMLPNINRNYARASKPFLLVEVEPVKEGKDAQYIEQLPKAQ